MDVWFCYAGTWLRSPKTRYAGTLIRSSPTGIDYATVPARAPQEIRHLSEPCSEARVRFRRIDMRPCLFRALLMCHFMTGGSDGNSCHGICASKQKGVSASLDFDLSWMSAITDQQPIRSGVPQLLCPWHPSVV